MIITVKEVKEGNSKTWQVIDSNGVKYGLWKFVGKDNPHDNPLKSLMVHGAVLDIETTPNKDPKYPPTISKAAVNTTSSDVTQQTSNQSDLLSNNKNRGFAMSYAKDLIVAGKGTTGELFDIADSILKWLDGKTESKKEIEFGG